MEIGVPVVSVDTLNLAEEYASNMNFDSKEKQAARYKQMLLTHNSAITRCFFVLILTTSLMVIVKQLDPQLSNIIFFVPYIMLCLTLIALAVVIVIRAKLYQRLLFMASANQFNLREQMAQLC